MMLDPTRPESWEDLSLHPQFEGKPFEKGWYDGNLDEDLLLLRRACATIVQSTTKYRPELVVLDDCTFFASFTYDGVVGCELYPAKTGNGERCLFFVFPKFPDLEIRVLTEQNAADVVLAFSREEDLTRFDEIE